MSPRSKVEYKVCMRRGGKRREALESGIVTKRPSPTAVRIPDYV
jgi:hypothetical protein